MTTNGRRFLPVFCLFWSAFVLGFDGFLGFNAWRQYRAEEYLTAPGTIAHIEVTSNTDSDGGTTYGVDVRYDYAVAGRKFTGDRRRYGAMSSSNASIARDFVKAHPKGSKVDVYYNPDDPADCVLETGFGGLDRLLLLFMTPFNMVMLFLWAGMTSGPWRRWRNVPAGGVPILKTSRGVNLRLPRFSPLGAGLATALAAVFVSIFIVAFGFNMNPSEQTMSVVWGVILGLAAAVYLWRRIRVGSGRDDLVIDLERNVFSLPQTFGRDGSAEYPLASVTGVDVDREVKTGSKGSSYTVYHPVLVFTDGETTRREPLAEWNEEPRAWELAGWLRERLAPDQGTAVAAE